MKPAAYLVTVMDSHGVTHVFRLAVGQDFTLLDAAKAGKILSVEPVTPGTPSEANEIDGMLKDSTWSAQKAGAWFEMDCSALSSPVMGIDKIASGWAYEVKLPYVDASVLKSALFASDAACQFSVARFPPCSPLEREARELLVWVELLAGREVAETCERDLLVDFKRGKARTIWGMQLLREFVPECMRLSAKDAVP